MIYAVNLYTVEQTAKLLNITVEEVEELIKQNKLSVKQLKTCIAVPYESIKQYLKDKQG